MTDHHATRTRRPGLTAQFYGGILAGVALTTLGEWIWRILTTG